MVPQRPAAIAAPPHVRAAAAILTALFFATPVPCASALGSGAPELATAARPRASMAGVSGTIRWQGPDAVLALADGPTTPRLVRIHLGSGRREREPAFSTKRLRLSALGALEWDVSPNGRWLLCATGDSLRARWTAAELMGFRTVTWPRAQNYWFPLKAMPLPYPSYCSWTSDSESWVEWSMHPTRRALVLHRVRDPRMSVRLFDLPSGRRVLATPSSTRVVLGADWDIGTGVANLEVWVRRTGAWVGKPARVRFPAGCAIEDIAVSPRGTHVACILWRGPSQSAATIGLYACRIDKGVMVEAARHKTSAPVGRPPQAETDDFPRHLSWTPNGLSLGFHWRGALYTLALPADLCESGP